MVTAKAVKRPKAIISETAIHVRTMITFLTEEWERPDISFGPRLVVLKARK